MRGHEANDCHFKNATCFKCDRKGHTSRVCTGKGKVHQVREQEYHEEDPEEGYLLKMHEEKKEEKMPYMVKVRMDGREMEMEVDTGASHTVMSEGMFKEQFPTKALKDVNLTLRTYSGEEVNVLGMFTTEANTNQQTKCLPVVVVRGGNLPRHPLLGRNWLGKIQLDWKKICKQGTLNRITSGNDLKKRYPGVFDMTSSEPMKNFKATLRVGDNVKPIVKKARPVPFAKRQAVEEELQEMVKTGKAEKVDHSRWASPVVAIEKANGRVRLCGDYKATVNTVLEPEPYPLPTADDLFGQLAGGRFFAKLDLKEAYLQLEVDESSRELLTLTTHQGLYRPTRLQYGVSSAPAQFQAIMDQVLAGIPGVLCYLDDVLCAGQSEQHHWKLVEEVVKRFDENNIRINLKKSVFLQKSVTYLGHVVDEDGLRPSPEKVKAIREAPTPRNVGELRSWLGLVGYYGKFIPQLSEKLKPLNLLLHKDTRWAWTEACEKAFQQTKEALSGRRVLAHYDPKQALKIATDASAYGIGAVLSQVDENGTEKPVYFASRTLTDRERGWAQVEKEALSIVYGVKKFHQFVYGRKFTLETDAQALVSVFSPKKDVPPIAAARIKRWALLLAAYDYHIVYRQSSAHANADGLSRLPKQGKPAADEVEGAVFQFFSSERAPIKAQQVATATRQDPLLSKVFSKVAEGWKHNEGDTDPAMGPFKRKKLELSLEGGCLLWGARVVIPRKLRQPLMQELHSGHQGATKMKGLARSYIWWPGIDEEIEDLSNTCHGCKQNAKQPEMTVVHPWVYPKSPWSRIHADYAVKGGKTLLIVVDGFSKWTEVEITRGQTAEETANVLRKMFARWGLPEEVVTDNGPCFTAEPFRQFLRVNGVRHLLTPPYHPSSNGAAENAVKTVKNSLSRQSWRKGSFGEKELADFLLMYRSTPHCTTGRTPSELHIGRRLKTRLSQVKPDHRISVEKKQGKQAASASGSRTAVFRENDDVLVRNVQKKTWSPGKVLEKSADGLRYRVRLQQGHERVVHLDHLIAGSPGIQMDPPPAILVGCSTSEPTPNEGSEPERCAPSPDQGTPSEAPPAGPVGCHRDSPESDAAPRRSGRTRRGPVKLDL